MRGERIVSSNCFLAKFLVSTRKEDKTKKWGLWTVGINRRYSGFLGKCLSLTGPFLKDYIQRNFNPNKEVDPQSREYPLFMLFSPRKELLSGLCRNSSCRDVALYKFKRSPNVRRYTCTTRFIAHILAVPAPPHLKFYTSIHSPLSPYI